MIEHKCQIHVEASDESHTLTRPCGRAAEWWADDATRDGSTLWLCDEHRHDIAQTHEVIRVLR